MIHALSCRLGLKIKPCRIVMQKIRNISSVHSVCGVQVRPVYNNDQRNRYAHIAQCRRNMDVLTGILLDVSGSMEANVDRSRTGQRGGSWAKSIFKFVDRLIAYDASSGHRVFAIGFGASCEQRTTFDVLSTLKELESLETSQKEKSEIIESAMEILEEHGAPRIRKWATVDEVLPHLEERQASILVYLLGNKEDFRSRFVDECLPEECRNVVHGVKSYATEAFNWTASKLTTEGHRLMTESSVSEVITKGMELTKEYILLEVSSYKTVYCVKDASEILHGSVGEDELTEQRADELFENVKPFMFGRTPLIRSMLQAVDLFSWHREQQYKLLFVVSDGNPTDGDNPPSAQLAGLGVTIVCCYITNTPIAEPRRLYSIMRYEWEEEAKFMFRMSSVIPTQKIPRTLFVKKGWQIDIDNNETRMFFQINHPDIIDEVCDLAKDCVCSGEALSDVLASVSLDLYINRANEGVTPDTQEGKTCYAIASATVMHLAMKRIIGREGGYPDFYQIRDELIGKYGVRSAKVGEVLRDVCPKYRLQFRKVDERGALSAVVEKRPVVAIFQLSDAEKRTFRMFYHQHPRGILRKSRIHISARAEGLTLSGHAVVLTSFNGEGLRLMNSWGSEFADGGFFKVQNAKVLGLQFYDIFWSEEDLLPSEKEAYNREGADISAKLMKSLKSLQTATYVCPLCSRESKVSDFRGHLLETQCPKCRETFDANESGSDLALNIYLTSLLSRDSET